MSGDSFISSVIPGSAVVFHFDEAYGLNQKQVSYDTACMQSNTTCLQV